MAPVRQQPFISGGGLVGMVQALSLARAGIATTLAETAPYTAQVPDNRSSAVILGAKRFFEQLGIWEDFAPHGTPMEAIRVYKQDSPWTVDYDYRDLGDEPLGHIIPNTVLWRVLRERVYADPLIRSIWGAHIEDVIKTKETSETDNGCESALHRLPDYGAAPLTLRLSNGESVKTPLLICAEGRQAGSRRFFNIRVSTWEYGQVALSTKVSHDLPHEHTAWEVFTDEGPMALLPLPDDLESGKPCSGLIWCRPKSFDWQKADEAALLRHLEELFPYFGAFRFADTRRHYPLSGLKVDRLYDHRFIMIGDAAHGLHPIAGQGVNLGWRDVMHLTKVISQYHGQGLDIGSVRAAEDYARTRTLDHRTMLLATGGLNRLFANPFPGSGFIAQAGMGMVNAMPFVKKFLMRRAMGI